MYHQLRLARDHGDSSSGKATPITLIACKIAKLIADWMEQHMTPSTANRPAFVDEKFTKAVLLLQPRTFLHLSEGRGHLCHGPGARVHGVLLTATTESLPAPTRRAAYRLSSPTPLRRENRGCSTGDIYREGCDRRAGSLLAKGYHILIVSPSLGSGMTQTQWDDAYKLLVENGFSKKPVLKGDWGDGRCEAYAWAVAKPEQSVSLHLCRFGIRSMRESHGGQNSNRLTTWRRWRKKACRSCTTAARLDPWLDKQTRVVRETL